MKTIQFIVYLIIIFHILIGIPLLLFDILSKLSLSLTYDQLSELNDIIYLSLSITLTWILIDTLSIKYLK